MDNCFEHNRHTLKHGKQKKTIIHRELKPTLNDIKKNQVIYLQIYSYHKCNCVFILQLNVKETRTDRTVQNVSCKSMQGRKYFDHYYSQKFTIMGYV
jgi:hypothetical protein